MKLSPFDPAAAGLPGALTRLWNAACGPALSISERLARFNLVAASGAATAGCLAEEGGQPVGFVLVSATVRPVAGLPHPSGWIEALAVLPQARRRGAGSRLLVWAEDWLSARNCADVRLGGGLRPFVPGLPERLGSAAFFLARGYAPRPGSGRVMDVARDLRDYVTPAFVPDAGLDPHPLEAGEAGALDNFLDRAFTGRWHYEFQEHLRQGGRPADYLALWDGGEIAGFCQVTFADSLRPLDRFYPHGLARPWGQLGPIGIHAGRRGQGLGGFLLDAGLRHLRARGVAGCVIDWTDVPGFYQKFGFRSHNEYLVLTREQV